MERQTRVIHPRKPKLPEGNVPLVSPVYNSVKYIPKNSAHLREMLADRSLGYIYSRIANPTVRELEILLADMQGRDDAICVASGIGAITTALMGLLKAGDRVLMFRESYKPTRYLLTDILARFGVRTLVLGLNERGEIERVFNEDPPNVLIFESPTNPVVRVPDISWLCGLCQKVGALSVLDNTFAGFHHHGDFPIDLFVHSLTKHACGHSDAMGGVIIASKSLVEQIFPVSVTLGATLDPHAAWLILRGMKTYGLRTREASANTQKIFEWLSQRPRVANLRFPGDQNHPDYKIWQKQMKGDGGTVLAFDLVCTSGLAESTLLDAFIDGLKVFTLTPSMGCVESLVAPCLQLFADDLSVTDAKAAGIGPLTVRLAVGVEAYKDLIEDLDQALTAVGL